MPSCSFKNPLSWMSVIALVLASVFLCYGFSSLILTSIVTLLSTLIFNFSKNKPTPRTPKKPIRENHLENPDIAAKLVLDREEEEDGGREQVRMEDESPLMLSDSRSSTSEDSGADDSWAYDQGNIFRSPDNSDDGSISDEDSLIEIALPSGVYIDHYKEEEEEKKKKLTDDLTFLKQQISLVELLAELNDMNEEDNLIEIDISMGSIKCPRFEIEA